MNWSMVKLDDVKAVHMRLEGEVNAYWTVTLKDGTVEKFYGYESGPHFESSDSGLDEVNPELYEDLLNLTFLEIRDWNSETEAVDYDLTLVHHTDGDIVGEVTNIEVQHEDNTVTSYRGDPPEFYGIRTRK
jgi:hypothetical protein